MMMMMMMLVPTNELLVLETKNCADFEYSSGACKHFRDQESDMKLIPSWGPTNVSRHRTKFSRPGHLCIPGLGCYTYVSKRRVRKQNTVFWGENTTKLAVGSFRCDFSHVMETVGAERSLAQNVLRYRWLLSALIKGSRRVIMWNLLRKHMKTSWLH